MQAKELVFCKKLMLHINGRLVVVFALCKVEIKMAKLDTVYSRSCKSSAAIPAQKVDKGCPFVESFVILDKTTVKV